MWGKTVKVRALKLNDRLNYTIPLNIRRVVNVVLEKLSHEERMGMYELTIDMCRFIHKQFIEATIREYEEIYGVSWEEE